MAQILFILAAVFVGGIVVFTLVSHYSVSRIVKFYILLLMALYSVVILVLSIMFVTASQVDQVLLISVAIWGGLVGFWIKTPLKILKD